MALKNCVILDIYNVEMTAVELTWDGVAEGKPCNVDLCIIEIDNEVIEEKNCGFCCGKTSSALLFSIPIHKIWPHKINQ